MDPVGAGAGHAVVRGGDGGGGGQGTQSTVDFRSRACRESEDRYNYIIIKKFIAARASSAPAPVTGNKFISLYNYKQLHRKERNNN